MASLFALLFLVCMFGVFKPFVKNSRRWHFGLAGFACLVLIGVFAPDPDEESTAQTEEGRTTIARGESEEEVDLTASVLTFHRQILNAMQPCDIASSRVADLAAQLGSGSSIYQAYSAAKSAEYQCRESWNLLSDLGVPNEFGGEIEEKAEETLERCENAAISKQMASEQLAEIFDGNFRPSAMETARERADAAQAGVLYCVAGIFDVAIAAGVDTELLASD